MNRREAISYVSVLLGGTLLGAEAFLSGCSPAGIKSEGLFSKEDFLLLDDISETIIPTTPDSGGAKFANVAAFMEKIVTDCYTPSDQKIFTNGIVKFNNTCRHNYQKPFSELDPKDKQLFLEALSKEAKDYEKTKEINAPTHYFTMIRQLTVWGYFSSSEGVTKALRYIAVPGRYDGIVSYKKGDKAWAT
jgi:hypothetical protein